MRPGAYLGVVAPASRGWAPRATGTGSTEAKAMASIRRVFIWTITIGGVAFALGFFGPMVLAPGANQGPLLGIFITGPLGVLVGFGAGVARELLGFTDGPAEVLGRLDPGRFWPPDARLVRGVAALAGVGLAVYGVAGLRRGEGRGAAAAVVIAAAALYFAATGQAPGWLRR